MTDDQNNRRHIEKNAENVEMAFNKLRSGAFHTTYKVAMGINNLVTIGTDRYKNNETLAGELLHHQKEWNDAKSKMMTPQDIRTDTAEHYASDMEDYLMQTALSQHFVNLAKVRAYRGAPFMMQDGVEILDASFNVWASNILEKGDHSYLNAFEQAIMENHPSSDDILVNMIAKFMGGVNGDALVFFWNSMKDNEKQQMMKEVKERQKARMGIDESVNRN